MPYMVSEAMPAVMSIPGMSAAYEKQALDKSAISFEIITRTKKYPELFTNMSLNKGDKNRLSTSLHD